MYSIGAFCVLNVWLYWFLEEIKTLKTKTAPNIKYYAKYLESEVQIVYNALLRCSAESA